MQYKLTFGRNSQLVPALILPAFILLVPMFLFLEFVDPHLPKSEWTSIILPIVYFLLVLFLTLRWVKATTAPVEITTMEHTLRFVFPKKNMFHRKDFDISFEQILNIGEDNDKGFDFLYFETNHTGYRSFHITAKEDDSDFKAFRNDVKGREASYNASVSTKNRITQKTMYQKWPMKTLALLLVLFWVAFPVVSLYLGTSWLNNVKYWVMVVLGTPIVVKVYSQNFAK